mmetsp:Transcript_16673/g.43194  ORF Transcript_16673/g.43194 Transcript_16673/m.43194 type:complete len:130 (-) Transcript_16673:309-698(-)|eukprot:CAMPEP_0119413878 /NCGR_PEP_ID=MMETSP1335-20130426/6162_1 /TAXON_ID=259385 /ORGANISM="Chrysoculter rhomboideus, Strain RCC1486" /LENGTH=129 /DNA_ID=CAMNT_0007438709 /DNA_START=72 /DNA_END=461 /DNA_ORIENTATION=+
MTAAKDHLSVEKDGIRLLPPDKLEQATAMQEDCNVFISKSKQFHEIVTEFMQVMDAKQQVIDAQKLRTIGLGNKVLGEEEARNRRRRELQATLNERKAELERLRAQQESLSRVDQEQRALIERLQNNEA